MWKSTKPTVSASASASGGIGFFGLLGVLFIGLKLTGNISWSWLWVLAPIWIPAAISIILLLTVLGLIVWADRKR